MFDTTFAFAQGATAKIASVALSSIFFYKFSPNPLIGRIGKDRAPAKQSLLR